jgi:S-DNA-T family DNA segregation ATPase FtsK/SpoIIIE
VQRRLCSAGIALVLLVCGAFLLFSLLAAVLHISLVKPSFLFAPGAFLYASFLFAAFYVPLYCFILSFLLVTDSFKVKTVVLLVTSLVPFLTLSLGLKVFFEDPPGDAALLVISSFGQFGGGFLLFLLFILELMGMARVSSLFRAPALREIGERKLLTYQSTQENLEQTGRDREDPASRALVRVEKPEGIAPESPKGRKGLSLRFVKAKDMDPALAPREEEAADNDSSDFTFSLPDIPELPELSSIKTEGESVEAQTPAETAPEAKDIPPGEGISTMVSAMKPIEGLASGKITDQNTGLDQGTDLEDETPLEDAEEAEEEDIPLAEEDEEEIEEPAKAKSPVIVPPVKKFGSYSVPTDKVLNDYPDGQYWIIDSETSRSSDVLKKTLEEFGIKAEVTGIRKGPVITMFEILPAPGVKLSKIVNLSDNIALRLAASSVRIVAPIPGKHAVGIEVPNKHRAIVSFKEMLSTDPFVRTKMEVPVILGKDITGEAQIVDLVQTPHLLIAGATGSGKSVCVNSIICSILYKRTPEEVRLMLIDPKIVELKLYNNIPHLLTSVITDPKRAFQALQYCIYEMERRYSLLDSLGVRDIRSYNRRIRERSLATLPLPYLVIVVDEFADLMATTGKELESTLARLAAMSRAVGIHLVLATQRPSIDVITGLIKANIPSRIAFMVAGKIDSRIIIDAVGAEKLLGRGDMLFASAWDPNPIRIQGAYLSEEEVERIVAHVRTLGEPDYLDDEIFFDEEEEADEDIFTGANDPLMERALEIVSSAGKASASYLQRRLKIGYNRAARLVEEMEMRGIVGPQNGSKPREILHIPDRPKD